MSASRAARGAAELCREGNVTASTGSAIRSGTSVTLSCQLAAASCWAAIFLNSSEQIRQWGGSVSKTFQVTTYGKHTFTCKTICDKAKIVCGIDIRCGSKEIPF